jgi:chemotaxis protein methyltransferase CheR
LLTVDSALGRRERELLTVRFSTGESYFFRDQGQIDLLAQTILPELIRRRERGRTLRLWSAGCSTGEEAYTLAMLVDELAPQLAGWKVTILATDINGESLHKAREGLYRDWSFRTLDAARKQRYFRPHGDRWQIEQRLRDKVTFRRLDLVRDAFPDPEADLSNMDLILCRNVFIYLDTQAVSRIAAKFAATLVEGGFLITAHSELFGHDVAPLRVRMFAQSAVFQRSAAAGDAATSVQAPELARAPAMPAAPFVQSAARTTAPAPRIALSAPAAPPAAPCSAPAETCEQLMQAAWRHADHGMPEAAHEDCRKAIALDAFDPRPYYLLAQLAQEGGDAARAKALMKKVIYLDPSFVAAYLELGALQAQAGENERAQRMYATARKVLRTLPAKAAIAPYKESTAAEVLAYVERLLGASAADAASTLNPARLHGNG